MINKKNIPNDIIIVIVFTLLTVIFIVFPPLSNTWIRTILGLPMVLFFPGYALIAALFPGKDDLDGIERVALSFGLSIAVVPLLGLGLNYTPWGIRLIPILITLVIFTLGMCVITRMRYEGNEWITNMVVPNPLLSFSMNIWNQTHLWIEHWGHECEVMGSEVKLNKNEIVD